MIVGTPGRVELKHAVPELLAEQALDWSRAFLPPDRGRVGQRVTSLYLDSPEFTFYRWHRQRRTHRFTLRVRAYGEQPADRVFVEVKRRAGDVRWKLRTDLPAASLAPVLLGGDREPAGGARGAAPDEFIARRRAYAARPIMLVSCLREALRDRGVAGEVAVTVDRRIMYQPTERPDLVADPDRWRAVILPVRPGSPMVILEMKYVNAPPAWMATLLRHLASYRVSFSKYSAAVQQHAAWSQMW